MPHPLLAPLQNFCSRLTTAFGPTAPAGAQPEAQLTGPVEDLFRYFPTVHPTREVALPGIGRPDLSLQVSGALTGYVELKPPGKGADPSAFRGAHDKKQWKKFQSLPNLLYTDGRAWALYRNGVCQGEHRLSGDPTTGGSAAATAADAAKLEPLLQNFLSWHPVAPSQPSELAKVLAPLCRLLRDDVTEGLAGGAAAPLTRLYTDWQTYFFPDATPAQFADAYAQTLTYALLLAQVSGASALDPATASATLRAGHGLLAEALGILTHHTVYEQMKLSLDVLRRTVGAVDPTLFRGSAADPWLYFYEDFLSAYDPALRKQRGVYYTPVEVVQAQVRLVDELLRTRLGAPYGFVDPNVATLDPACGTGTYLLAALRHGLDRVAAEYGPGAQAQYATTAAQNLYAFEVLVGPYAVAHLRLTQQVLVAGGTLPPDGIGVIFADTLEAPHATPPGHLPMQYQTFSDEHLRAQRVKAEVPILVCLGNPPYLREQHDPADGPPPPEHERHGGWVRFGDPGTPGNRPLLRDFLDPLTATDAGTHAKNLYNDYVYFWRWALWKAFEQPPQRTGIVSFITASSYLRGPGFAGMRQLMRETFDELWIIDLGGDNLGSRKTANVFAIQTPVCIAIGIRTGTKAAGQPAAVHYCRLGGSATDKLTQLAAVHSFADLTWRECPNGATDYFLPDVTTTDYTTWPKLTDIFPWQTSGMQFKRPWPIGETPAVLQARWGQLLSVAPAQRGELFKESRDRSVTGSYADLSDSTRRLTPLANLPSAATTPEPRLINYRSFDRQWALIDNRVGDYLRPSLQQVHGPQQVYLTCLLTKVLGEGPAAVATELIPDLDCFCNRGGRDVIPLYRDVAGTQPNLPAGLLPLLTAQYSYAVAVPDVLAYAYALLATPRYVALFWDELESHSPHLPFTADGALFEEVATVGRDLLRLHTWGQRFGVAGVAASVPRGVARLAVGTPGGAADYPTKFRYDETTQVLVVGDDLGGAPAGRFSGVAPAVWEYSVSGLQVVDSWLGYRKRERSGRSSSPLDAIRPATWTFDLDLLQLLWVLEATLAALPAATALLGRVLAGPLLLAADLPTPTTAERKGPARPTSTGGLFD